jgi:2-isopropylmalate synthase
LADAVYSGVVAADFGFRQKIRIGPMSGRSNVLFWMEQRGIEATEEKVERVFAAAKKSDRLLEDSEIHDLLTAAAEA